MPIARRSASSYLCALVVICIVLFPTVVHAGNEVMGEVQFEGKSKVEKTSGVWIDGQYVGYLKELKGSKKCFSYPESTLSPCAKTAIRISLKPSFCAREKSVGPGRHGERRERSDARLLGQHQDRCQSQPGRRFHGWTFVGHVGEFEGVGRSLLVAPGQHAIKIALPGYKTFETQINPTANQKVEVKTDLVKNDVPVNDPSLKSGANAGDDHAPPPPPEPAGSPQR